MLACSLAAAVAVALTWSVTPAVAVTLVLFAASGALVAMRTVSGTVYGFSVAGDLGREVGTVRAVTTQLGYLIGALVGGAAIALGGFALLGVAMGGLFLASTLPYASPCIVSRAKTAARSAVSACAPGSMQTRALQLGDGQAPHGPTATERGRRHRHGGVRPARRAVPPLALQRAEATAPEAELAQLATVDATRHALVGCLKGDARPSRSRASCATERARRSRSRLPTSTSGSASARRSPPSCSRTRARPGSPRSRRSSRARTQAACPSCAGSWAARGPVRGDRAVGPRRARLTPTARRAASPRAGGAPARGSA